MSAEQPIDRVLHSEPRIAIMIRLVIDRRLRFSALCKMTDLTPGNMATHLRVLTEAGYVSQDLARTAERNRVIVVTDIGERAFREYAQTMRRLLANMEKASADPDGRAASTF